MHKQRDNETYQRILQVAGELFATRGYEAVTLREIGEALGIEHASLYYYARGGKKQLYLEVMEHNLLRHREGIAAAIAGAGGDLRAQLKAVGRWLVSQPPLEMSRIIQADAAGLGEDEAARLSRLAYDALREPLVAALAGARSDGQIALRNLDMGALAFLTLIEVVHSSAAGRKMPMDAYLDELIDMLMSGWVGR
jgi:AcrR family transcriptional regulator